MQNTPIVETQNLQYHFTSHDPDNNAQSIEILQNVSLSIKSAEQVAIIGRSGSGKSTLLSLLSGLDVPTGGTVQINGERFSQLDEDGRAATRAAYMGFVFQSFQLLPSLTALENVMLPLQLKNADDAREASLAALAQVGLSQRLKHYPKQLSGGEQQRVADCAGICYTTQNSLCR